MDRMSWYVVRRLMVLIIGILVILTAEFVILRVIPDDPALLALPRIPTYSDYDQLEEVLAIFDKPLYEQYVQFIGDMLSGEFYISYIYESDVNGVVFDAAWRTIALFAASLSICLVVGSLSGHLISRMRSHFWRQLASLTPLALLSVSVVIWAYVLQQIFSVRTGLLPMGGFTSVGSTSFSLSHAILPVMSVLLASIGWFILVVRDGQTRTYAAFASGPRSFRDGLYAAMPNLQIMTALSMCFVITVEVWFSYPGLGFVMIQSLYNMDYFLLQAAVFMLAVVVFLTNFSMETVVTLIRPGNRLDLYLGEDKAAQVAVPSPAPLGLVGWRGVWSVLTGIVKDYLRSPVGVLALAVLTVFVAIAAVGPSLTSDEFVMPYIYSPTDLFLNGATPLIAVSFIVGLIASAVGMLLGVVAGLVRPYADWLVTGVMQGLLAIPILCLAAIILLSGTHILREGDYFGAAMATMAPFIALITLLVCHGFVSSRKRLGPEGRRSLVSHAPAVTSWTLSGLKYCMPMAAIAIVLCDFMGLMGLHSWGYSIKLAFNFGMFLRGEWDYIIPPLLGLLFLVGSMFLVLDTLERVVRSRFSRWV